MKCLLIVMTWGTLNAAPAVQTQPLGTATDCARAAAAITALHADEKPSGTAGKVRALCIPLDAPIP